MSDYPNLGDLATEVAEKLRKEHLEQAEKGERDLVDERAPMVKDNKRSPFAKIEFSWRASDKSILEQIRTASREVFWVQFSDVVTALDKFYASVRIPETRSVGNQEVVVREASGSIRWKRDSGGEYAEDWDSLTGQDIDALLFDLQRIKLILSQQVTELMNEAVFARHIAQDAYDDAWGSLLEGTQGDRSARASRESRPDRYHAFFRWCLYSQADAFMKELSQFLRVAERIRNWRIQEIKG